MSALNAPHGCTPNAIWQQRPSTHHWLLSPKTILQFCFHHQPQRWLKYPLPLSNACLQMLFTTTHSGNEGDCLWLEFHPQVKAQTIQERNCSQYIHWTLKMETQVKAAACYHLVTLWVLQSVLQHIAFLSHLSSLLPKNNKESEAWHWLNTPCSELYPSRSLVTDSKYQSAVLGWSPFWKGQPHKFTTSRKQFCFNSLLKCPVLIFLFLNGMQSRHVFCHILTQYQLLTAVLWNTKTSLLPLTNMHTLAKHTARAAQENPNFIQPLFPELHFVVFDRYCLFWW